MFTKNRPLQLEGYLRSLYIQFPAERIETKILYKQELFTEQYDEVFDSYRQAEVIRESDFHSNLLDIIERAETKYILFGIDDVIFFDGVDLAVVDETFEKAKGEIFGFSLRFGLQSLEGSNDEIGTLQVAGQEVYFLDWTKGQTPHTRYPFELCATFYRTSLVKYILANTMSNNRLARRFFSPASGLVQSLPRKIRRKILRRFGFIFSPNTLESWPCRWCQRNRDKVPARIYFQKLCASALQVNMVNTCTRNTFDAGADTTVESLNEKFKQGFRLDTEYFSNNPPAGPSCGREYLKLVNRKTEIKKPVSNL